MNELDLFAAAIAIADDRERAALLDRECAGRSELRQRLDKLLAAHAQSHPLLDAGRPEATGAYTPRPEDDHPLSTPPSEAAGTLIAGKYTLVEPIGEGGMGSVWRAKQTEPVKRFVAVKLIKPGMDSRQVLARFEAERQALALMDHPNIAKVLDGGLHEQRPFFVMEMVKGVPITQFCDHNKLTPKQRLELFVPVCQAIQHAHQKGIIHRDIKPSNVLIALYDDKPVPKVIDFGVAKATGGALTEQTIETAFGGVVGTPQYMSPEQATLNNLDIDTRSDVYALGVLLYELLTGSPPFSQKELEKRGLLEMLRVVREEEPPRPSTKLSTADALPTLSANRGTEPKKLTGLLRNELDWIVMKALEKDRTRRYETANGFAADVQRYLSGEAVIAHPPSAAYRLRKFVRRNKGRVIAASLVLLALVVGIVGTTLGLLEARRQAGIAQTKEAEATRQAGIAREEAAEKERQREIAESQKKRALEFQSKAVDTLLATTGEDVEKLLGEKKDLTANEKAYLEAIAKRWQSFAMQEGTDEMARSVRAQGRLSLGRLWLRLGRRQEAQPEYEQAISILGMLTTEFPTGLLYRAKLAICHNDLGLLLRDLGKRVEALEHCRRGLALREKLATEFPAAGRYRADLAESHLNLGVLLMELGKLAEAEEQYRTGLPILEELAAEFPALPRYRAALAATHHNLGLLLFALGRHPEAEEQYRNALTLRAKLAAEFPTVPQYRAELAASHTGLGAVLFELGRRAEVDEQFRKSLALQQELATEFPAVPQYRQELAKSYSSLGTLQNLTGKWAEAEGSFRKGLELREQLVAGFPAVSEYKVDLGDSYSNIGFVVRNSGKLADSLTWFEKAITTLRPVYEAEPQAAMMARQILMLSHRARAQVYRQLNKYAEAAMDYDRVVEFCSPQDRPRFRVYRALAKLRAGQVAEAVDEVVELQKQPKLDAGQLYDFACFYSLASGKVADKKQEYADAAMEILTKAVNAGWKDVAKIKSDADLASIRGRVDFQKLLADLEGKISQDKK